MVTIAAHTKVVNIDSNPLPANSSSLAHAGEVLDDTNFASANFHTRISGLRDWTLQASGPYDDADPAMVALFTKWLSGAVIAVEYLPDGTNGFGGNAIISDFTLSGDVDGMETFTLTAEGAGALAALP